MGYLQPTDYENFGLAPNTTDDWITAASALMDAHCRRTSLSVTQYVERLRVVEGSQSIRLSYLPLAVVAPGTSPWITVRARYARPRRGEIVLEPMRSEIAWAFSLPGTWTMLDSSTLDFVADTGEVTLPYNLLGLPYNEVEVTYTAGLTVIPSAVQSACAQIVKNAQATPSLNVKSTKMDTMRMDYFAATLLDEQVKALLRPYVSCRLG
ncbi:MAG TPA: hypothetical protein VM554_10390 [Acidisarcina sp.]|nr:hypothetical protein [Acidisarcina sp.]